jgi:formylglycine-generating enzyme required for sulfatase activity
MIGKAWRLRMIAGAGLVCAVVILMILLGDSPARRAQMGAAKALGVPVERTIDLGHGESLAMALIPAGEFLMGSPQGEAGRGGDEGPVHRVRITKPFYMGKYPVTQAQWLAVMRDNPSHFTKDPKCPVDSVSWDDCREFARRADHGFRLPTEAEWEYACRAMSRTAYSFGDDNSDLRAYAWYDWNDGARPQDVGKKRPNAWGLYDMYGNVFEWCQDWSGPYEVPRGGVSVDPVGPAEGTIRVLRGGAFNSDWDHCRSAARGGTYPSNHSYNFGCRVAMDANSPSP